MKLPILTTVALLVAATPALAQVGFPASEGGRATVEYNVFGDRAREELSRPLALGGDVNGDGIEDFLARPRGQKYGGGVLRVYSGADGSLIREHSETASSNRLGNHLGNRFASMGDLNGDGAPEYMASVPGAEVLVTRDGKVNLYDGATGTLLRSVTTAKVNAYFGVGFAGGADFDGDGIMDFAVQAGIDSAFGFSGSSKFRRLLIYSGADWDTGLFWAPRKNILLPAPRGASLSVFRDVNDDGNADLLLWNGGSQEIRSGLDGTLLEIRSGAGIIYYLDDITGDGVDEIREFDSDFNGGAAKFTIRDGVTGAIVHEHVGTASSPLELAYNGLCDFDNDGVLDYGGNSAVDDIFAGYRGEYRIYSGRTGRLILNFKPNYNPQDFGLGGFGLDVDGDGADELLLTSPQYNALGGARRGVMTVLKFDPMIEASATTISSGRGGTINFDIDFWGAGTEFALLASSSGVGTTMQGPIHVPLIYDALTTSFYSSPPSWLVNSRGTTNSLGQATARIVAQPDDLASFVGQTLRFSAVGFNGALGAGVHWATVPIAVTINP